MVGKSPRVVTAERPIMALLELIGRRWILRILWELRGEPLNFRALRERCERISPTVLNERLKALRAHNLVELSDDGYQLSLKGRELASQLVTLSAWARDWVKTVKSPQ